MTGTRRGPRSVGREPAVLTRVFISYRHDDTAGYAGWIKTALEKRLGESAELFIDIDNIPPGTDFVHHIQQEVGRCQVVLALIGPAWLTTQKTDGTRRLDDPKDFIRLELEAAISHGTKVIPLLLHGAKMPDPAEVPAALQPITYKEALEVREKGFDYDLDSLAKNISPEHAVLKVSPTPPGRIMRRWMLAGIGVAVIVALAVGAYISMSGGSSFPNSDEKTLLSRAGVSAHDCKRAPRAGAQPGQVAAVSCSGTLGGPDSVIYSLFGSGTDLGSAFEAKVHSANITTEGNGDDCSDFPTAAFRYSSSSTSGGNVLCYVEGGNSYIGWTDDDARVLAVAQRTDTHDRTLYAWWSAKVSRTGLPAQADLNLLTGHVQSTHQAACHFYNKGLVYGTPLAINCRNSDFDIDYFQFSTTAAMYAEYTKLLHSANPPARTGNSALALVCPSQSNATQDGATIGQVFCEIDSATQHPNVWWTDDQLDILSWVGAYDTDQSALSAYWGNTGNVFPVATP